MHRFIPTEASDLTIRIVHTGSDFVVKALAKYEGKGRGLEEALKVLSQAMYKRRSDLSRLEEADLSDAAQEELAALEAHLGKHADDC